MFIRDVTKRMDSYLLQHTPDDFDDIPVFYGIQFYNIKDDSRKWCLECGVCGKRVYYNDLDQGEDYMSLLNHLKSHPELGLSKLDMACVDEYPYVDDTDEQLQLRSVSVAYIETRKDPGWWEEPNELIQGTVDHTNPDESVEYRVNRIKLVPHRNHKLRNHVKKFKLAQKLKKTKKVRKYRETCQIVGCYGLHTTADHRCELCKTGVDHTRERCPERCRVRGCIRDMDDSDEEKEILHTTKEHKCHVCNKIGVDHVTAECPEMCHAKGCHFLHTTAEHDCEVCGEYGVDHISKNCPIRCTLGKTCPVNKKIVRIRCGFEEYPDDESPFPDYWKNGYWYFGPEYHSIYNPECTGVLQYLIKQIKEIRHNVRELVANR